MREIRSSGSVEGVLSNGHPYSDFACGSALRSPNRSVTHGLRLGAGRSILTNIAMEPTARN